MYRHHGAKDMYHEKMLRKKEKVAYNLEMIMKSLKKEKEDVVRVDIVEEIYSIL